MSERTTNILGFVTLIAVLGLIWIFFGEETPSRDKEETTLYPALADQLGQLDQVIVKAPGDTTTLTRVADAWQVAERDGYPANEEKLRSLVLSLARTQRVEPKTDNPELFNRIGLGLDAGQLTLNAGDEAIADLYVGDRQANERGADRTFVRRADEPRSWLVEGLEPVEAAPQAWLAPELLELSRKRLASITISNSNGETLSVSRGTPQDPFALAGVNETVEELTGPTALDRVVNVPLYITLEDVRPATDASATATTRYTTFDGLALTIELVKQGDAWWARLTADHDPTAAEGKDGPAVMPDAPADGAAEAARLSARFAGRAFRLPPFKAQAINITRDELVVPLEPEEVEDPAP